jgi:transposase InsO family protein
MTITMNDSKIMTIEQVQKVLKSSARLEFKGVSRRDKYRWVSQTLHRFNYASVAKRDKGILKAYIQRLTGFSRAQITRLISRQLSTGKLIVTTRSRHRFPAIYTLADRQLLARVDNAHQRLSGPATRRLLERAYEIHGDERFIRLKNISSAHIYNLRATPAYQRLAYTFAGTRAVRVAIGVRRRPDPEGRPGWIRVDTVHQGDQDGQKGAYHINLIDVVTQWEIVLCVEQISERFLVPALEGALNMFPFRILGFHSDNGSEYINRIVASLLNKLLIEQTKSRSGRTNDNALVEGKNGSVIRKHMGYGHIPPRHAGSINEFYRTHFNDYLNYHRPCGFATLTMDHRGKRRRKYETYQTPFERFRMIPGAAQCLRPGVTLAQLDAVAARQTDTEAAETMQREKDRIFGAFDVIKCGGKNRRFHTPRGRFILKKEARSQIIRRRYVEKLQAHL